MYYYHTHAAQRAYRFTLNSNGPGLAHMISAAIAIAHNRYIFFKCRVLSVRACDVIPDLVVLRESL